MPDDPPKTFLYLMSEDDWDDQVIQWILEVMKGRQFELVSRRFRKGGGLGEVRKKLPFMLREIRNIGVQDHTVFAVAMDNDRLPEHPDHTAHPHTDSRPCRFCSLEETIQRLLPDGRPVPGAIAVPVQMIEAWLLLLHDATKYPREATLPVYARRDQSIAVRRLGNDGPAQLKDLVELEAGQLGVSKFDFAMRCVVSMDVEALAARSPSFALFKEQVAAWP